MKKVLMLNASHNDERIIRALKNDLGCYVITTGNRPYLKGHRLADEYIYGDFTDKELILKIAKEKHIEAVCGCCNDFGALTAAYVSERLGLPGYDPYETSLTLNHKDRFKKFTREQGILAPLSETFGAVEIAVQYIFELSENAFPLIVKPADLSGGIGISKVNCNSEAAYAVKLAFSKSKIGRIVIEPFLAGTQHGFCTFLIDKKVAACISNNEYSIVNPFRVEIDTFPAENHEDVKDVLISEIEKIAEILNLGDGIFHLQYIYSGGKPWIIEVMRRIIGNIYMLPAGGITGINWDYWEARKCLGLDLSGFPRGARQSGFYAYRIIKAPSNGIVRNVIIPENIKKKIYFEEKQWEPGRIVVDYLTEYLSFLFFKFDSREEMNNILLDNYGEIRVVMR